MRRMKLIYVISGIDKSIGFEWLAEKLDRNLLDISFVLLSPAPSTLGRYLRNLNYKVEEWKYTRKSELPALMWKMFLYFRKERPDIVHAHLFEAALSAMFTSRLAGIARRIYTRHHGDFHQKYHPSSVKYDKLINSMATEIVAVSGNVKQILTEQEGVAPEKVAIIHHGFDFDIITKIKTEDAALLAQKYNPSGRRPVVGVISRYIHWKGLQFIIPAFKKLLNDYPQALLILANARGDYHSDVQKLLLTLPPDSFVEIPFENDIFILYQIFDLFIHTPIDKSSEAFGQTYIEALAAGVPSVFTISGIAADFIKHERNAMVVDYMNSEQIYEAAQRILKNPDNMHEMIKTGKRDVKSAFGLEKMITETQNLYL